MSGSTTKQRKPQIQTLVNLTGDRASCLVSRVVPGSYTMALMNADGDEVEVNLNPDQLMDIRSAIESVE